MFTKEDLQLEDYELFLFASPERRCLYGLKTLPKLGQLRRAWIADFIDYEAAQSKSKSLDDKKVASSYHDNLSSILTSLASLTAHIERKKYKLNILEPFDDSLGEPSPFECPLVVDISCAPRGHLLALLNYLARCQLANYQHIILMYSLVRQQASSESAYSYGMQDVAVVPGFNGQVRLKHDLLIIVLGFEGNRAHSLFRRLAPNKGFLIIGDTDDETDRSFYIEGAKKNNHGLLNIDGNEMRFMPSRDPVAFAHLFGRFLNEEIKPLSDRYNIYFSCLGTKLQTVGAFLALQSHPYIQVVDELPTRRRISSEGGRQTIFADYGTKGLIDPNVF